MKGIGVLHVLFICMVACAFIACDCQRATCEEERAVGRFSFLQDSVDLFFGEDRRLGINELTVTASDSQAVFLTITNDEIQFNLKSDVVYHVEIGTLDTIMVTADLRFDQETDCCTIFGFNSISIDGEMVCVSNCGLVEYRI